MQIPGLFWRAVVAFLVLPTVVAFLVPWLLLPSGAHFHALGFPVVGIGVVLLLWCVRDFYVAGRGTLAPWAPPTRLVTVGLYRISRNPMYVAVWTVLLGFAIGYRATALWIYAAVVGIAFHLRVIMYEEPWLGRTFGASWLAYRNKVPRWIGRRPGVATEREHESAS
ncbi:MAG: methyltransferase family protein [Gemmatimonadaceae bacterium]